jgi:hypothetical protein
MTRLAKGIRAGYEGVAGMGMVPGAEFAGPKRTGSKRTTTVAWG